MIAAWVRGIIYSLTARCLVTNILHPNLQKFGCLVKAEREQDRTGRSSMSKIMILKQMMIVKYTGCPYDLTILLLMSYFILIKSSNVTNSIKIVSSACIKMHRMHRGEQSNKFYHISSSS